MTLTLLTVEATCHRKSRRQCVIMSTAPTLQFKLMMSSCHQLPIDFLDSAITGLHNRKWALPVIKKKKKIFFTGTFVLVKLLQVGGGITCCWFRANRSPLTREEEPVLFLPGSSMQWVISANWREHWAPHWFVFFSRQEVKRWRGEASANSTAL